MNRVLFVVCPWCNVRQKTELSGIYHSQSTDDFHEFLCQSCGKPFTIDKEWLRTQLSSPNLNDPE